MRTAVLIFLFFAGIVVHSSCEDSRAQMVPDQPKNPDAEKLAKAIVSAISTDNYAAFTDLLLTQQEYLTTLRSSTDPHTQQKVNDSTDAMHRLHMHTRKSFDEVRRKGIRDGLAWERVTYKSSNYSIDTVDGVELIHLTIRMDFRGVEYLLTAQEVIRTKTGWKISGNLQYGDMPAYHRAEDLARQMQDSIRVTDSLMAAYLYLQADSALKADSLYTHRKADSISMADSIAAASRIKKKKGKH